MSEDERRIEMRAIHVEQKPDEGMGALMTPIYVNSTYAQDGPGDHHGYEYSRTGNPTRTDLESNLMTFEHGSYGRAFASGMGSINTALNLLEAGDRVVTGNDVYGDTHRIFTQVYEKYDLEFDFVDTADHDATRDTVSEEIELVWVETPTNLPMRANDIGALAGIAHEADALCAVDNTSATPYLQHPPDHGVGIVSHPLTRYLGGHPDIVGGALVTDDEGFDEKLGFYQNSAGAMPSPFNCSLVLRRTKTLPVRMNRHCDNTRDLVAWLDDHETVSEVFHPGLDSHPQHDPTVEQMDDFGGTLSFELDGPFEQASTVVEEIRAFTLAESLDGVESFIEQLAAMTHVAIPREGRPEAGLIDDLIRVLVDIEHVNDIKAGLQRVFNVAF